MAAESLQCRLLYVKLRVNNFSPNLASAESGEGGSQGQGQEPRSRTEKEERGAGPSGGSRRHCEGVGSVSAQLVGLGLGWAGWDQGFSSGSPSGLCYHPWEIFMMQFQGPTTQRL